MPRVSRQAKAALPVDDLLEDVIHSDQNPSQQGVLLKQGVHLVAVLVIPKRGFSGRALFVTRQMLYYSHDYTPIQLIEPAPTPPRLKLN